MAGAKVTRTSARSRAPAELAGAVLAGGESRRMGRDKAGVKLGGEPMWRRQARVLADAGASPVVVVRRGGQEPVGTGIRQVRDAFAGAGPLAGLHAALGAVGTPWLAVLAVDMPSVDGEWFGRLWALCRPGGGAVAQHAAGYEPLAAIYPREALGIVTRRLETGRRSLQELVAALVRARRMAVLPLPEAERWRMENWNTPADRRGRSSRAVMPGARRATRQGGHAVVRREIF